MSDEQKPGDPADKAADGAFLAWVASHPTVTLASKEEARLLDEIDRLRDENAALRAAVERVRALHQPIAEDIPKCVECKNYDGRHVDHPCPTLRALEGTP